MLGNDFRAFHRLQDAANLFLTASTLTEHGQPAVGRAYREMALRELGRAADALGFELTSKLKPSPGLKAAAEIARSVLAEQHDNCGGCDDTIYAGPIEALNAALAEVRS